MCRDSDVPSVGCVGARLLAKGAVLANVEEVGAQGMPIPASADQTLWLDRGLVYAAKSRRGLCRGSGLHKGSIEDWPGACHLGNKGISESGIEHSGSLRRGISGAIEIRWWRACSHPHIGSTSTNGEIRVGRDVFGERKEW